MFMTEHESAVIYVNVKKTYLNLTFLFSWSKISEVLVPHVWHQYGNPDGVTQRNSAVDLNRRPRQ